VARARTGTLIPPDKDGPWKARVTKTHEDGSVSRPVYSLGTTDQAIARRKLAQLVAALAKARGALSRRRSADAAHRSHEHEPRHADRPRSGGARDEARAQPERSALLRDGRHATR